MTSRIQRLVVVGLGSIGQRHARLARRLLPHVEIIALRRDASGPVEEGLVNGVVTTIEEAVRFRPDAAVIASPATLHLAAAMPLADCGAHLLVEKPMAATARGVADLVALCERKRLTLMTGYNLRYLQSLSTFREMIHEGRIGTVRSMRAVVGQFLPSWRAGDYRQTVSARAALGGGVLMELSHEIDYLRWILGDVDRVSATLARQSDMEIDVEDTAHLVLTFAPGASGRRVIASVDMDFIRHDATRTCTAIGDGGTLRWNARSGTVELFEPRGEWTVVVNEPVERDDSYLAEWRDFLRCIESGERPLVSGDDGLQVMRIIDGARESAAAGKVVQLDTKARQGRPAAMRT